MASQEFAAIKMPDLERGRVSCFLCADTGDAQRAAVAQNAQAVESGIVGYQTINVTTNFSLFTPTFRNITTNAYDLADVIPCDASGNPFSGPSSMGKIFIQRMDDTGKYLAEYKFLSITGKWTLNNVPIVAGHVMLAPGESICVNNGQGVPITFKVNGEVVLSPQSYTLPENFSLIGNMTPTPVDLLDVELCDVNGVKYTGATSMGKVFVQKMNDAGKYLAEYKYLSITGKWTLNNVPIGAGAVMLQPGESFCVNNGQGAPIILKFPDPTK